MKTMVLEIMRIDVTKRLDNTGVALTAASSTYGQLIKDWELFTAMRKRKKMMLIADEIHRAGDRDGNADKNFGAAISSVAEVSAYNLALSGTPFKTDGSSIALCPSEPTVDDWGRPCRKTLPIYTYSYGRALRESVCRPEIGETTWWRKFITTLAGLAIESKSSKPTGQILSTASE